MSLKNLSKYSAFKPFVKGLLLKDDSNNYLNKNLVLGYEQTLWKFSINEDLLNKYNVKTKTNSEVEFPESIFLIDDDDNICQISMDDFFVKIEAGDILVLSKDSYSEGLVDLVYNAKKVDDLIKNKKLSDFSYLNINFKVVGKYVGAKSEVKWLGKNKGLEDGLYIYTLPKHLYLAQLGG